MLNRYEEKKSGFRKGTVTVTSRNIRSYVTKYYRVDYEWLDYQFMVTELGASWPA
jgi:hypothetical protein